MQGHSSFLLSVAATDGKLRAYQNSLGYINDDRHGDADGGDADSADADDGDDADDADGNDVAAALSQKSGCTSSSLQVITGAHQTQDIVDQRVELGVFVGLCLKHIYIHNHFCLGENTLH